MDSVESALHCARLSVAACIDQPQQWKNNALGVICYSTDADACQVADMGLPCIRVPMPSLDAGDSICEVWQGGGHMTQGSCGDIHYRHDGDVLYGSITMAEERFADGADKTPLHKAAELAYGQIFALLEAQQFPYLYRFWNYFGDINGYSFGLERYRQFNMGRQDAFIAYGREAAGNAPAACALGSAEGPLSIAFLAGRAAPLNIENPRQVSACQYPRQYGPRSPLFSRASLVRLRRQELLFISGTASIVGHATQHPADVGAQTGETMNNIEAVLGEANRVVNVPAFDLASLHYKVYVRHVEDFARIRGALANRVGDELTATYLRADVCRRDLLLEIEATASRPLPLLSGGRA
jgi:chorismate lyase / 3-hydroxybenzoate synthase